MSPSAAAGQLLAAGPGWRRRAGLLAAAILLFAGLAAAEVPGRPSQVRLSLAAPDTALLSFQPPEGEAAAAPPADYEAAFWTGEEDEPGEDARRLVRLSAGQVRLVSPWNATVQLRAAVRAASADGEFGAYARAEPATVRLEPEGAGAGADEDGALGWARSHQYVALGAAAAAVLLACTCVCWCRRRRRRAAAAAAAGKAGKAGQGQSRPRQSSAGRPRPAAAAAAAGSAAAAPPTGKRKRGAYAEQVDADELELELELGLGGEAEPALELTSLMEPEYDSAWFQSRWEAVGGESRTRADLVSHLVLDTESLEEALEAKNFCIVASGAPSDTQIKVYFFGKPGGAGAEPVLAEMVVNTEALTMDAVFKSRDKASVSACRATFRRAMDRFIAERPGGAGASRRVY